MKKSPENFTKNPLNAHKATKKNIYNFKKNVFLKKTCFDPTKRSKKRTVFLRCITLVATSSNQPLVPQEFPAGGPEGLPKVVPNLQSSEFEAGQVQSHIQPSGGPPNREPPKVRFAFKEKAGNPGATSSSETPLRRKFFLKAQGPRPQHEG